MRARRVSQGMSGQVITCFLTVMLLLAGTVQVVAAEHSRNGYRDLVSDGDASSYQVINLPGDLFETELLGVGDPSSSWPLGIAVTNDLACQYDYHDTFTTREMYPGDAPIVGLGARPGDCGTFLAVDGTLYGPDIAYWGFSKTSQYLGNFDTGDIDGDQSHQLLAGMMLGGGLDSLAGGLIGLAISIFDDD